MFGKLFRGKNAKGNQNSNHPSDFDTLLEKAFHHTQALQSAHSETWRMGEAENFNVDFETGKILWSFADGVLVTADAQLIATWSDKDGSYLWGWDHPMCPPAPAEAAHAVKNHADMHQIQQLQVRKIECEIDDGWQLAAIAVLLGNLQGVYRAPASAGAFAYIGFKNIEISKQ